VLVNRQILKGEADTATSVSTRGESTAPYRLALPLPFPPKTLLCYSTSVLNLSISIGCWVAVGLRVSGFRVLCVPGSVSYLLQHSRNISHQDLQGVCLVLTTNSSTYNSSSSGGNNSSSSSSREITDHSLKAESTSTGKLSLS